MFRMVAILLYTIERKEITGSRSPNNDLAKYLLARQLCILIRYTHAISLHIIEVSLTHVQTHLCVYSIYYRANWDGISLVFQFIYNVYHNSIDSIECMEWNEMINEWSTIKIGKSVSIDTDRETGMQQNSTFNSQFFQLAKSYLVLEFIRSSRKKEFCVCQMKDGKIQPTTNNLIYSAIAQAADTTGRYTWCIFLAM